MQLHASKHALSLGNMCVPWNPAFFGRNMDATKRQKHEPKRKMQGKHENTIKTNEKTTICTLQAAQLEPRQGHPGPSWGPPSAHAAFKQRMLAENMRQRAPAT